MFITAFSNVVKAVAPLANRNKVLMLSVGANSPEIKNLGKFVYTTFPLADVDMKALPKYLYGKLGKRKAAVLYVNHETGRAGAKVFRDNFIKAGGKVALFESYEQQRSDFTGLVLKVKSANPDVVHIHSVIRDFTAIVAQMRQLGMTVQVTSYQTAFNPKMIKALGKGAEGIIVTALAPSVQDNKNLPGYLARWKKGSRPRADRPAVHPVLLRCALYRRESLQMGARAQAAAHGREHAQGARSASRQCNCR